MDLKALGHAFVTGGASGIGLGIADALARRGVKITIADIDAASAAQVVAERGEGFQAVVLDVRDRAGWQAAKEEAESRFGPVGILVNNAGIAPDGKLFAAPDPESFERIIAINLMGVYNGVATFVPDMVKAHRGYVLNVASMAGISIPPPGTGGYVAAKFAITGLTEALRQETSDQGVCASVMCPGLVDTNLPKTTEKVTGVVRSTSYGMPPGAMSAGKAGEMAVRGMEREDMYILTHFDRFEPVKERFRVIEAAFRRGPDADLA